jgi:hypothetical protein
VVEAWESGALQMIFTPYSVTGANSYIADGSPCQGVSGIHGRRQAPTRLTAGSTVSYPLSEFNYSFDGSVSANKLTADMMRGLTFYVWHGGVAGKDCNPHICIDNIRVVPK